MEVYVFTGFALEGLGLHHDWFMVSLRSCFLLFGEKVVEQQRLRNSGFLSQVKLFLLLIFFLRDLDLYFMALDLLQFLYLEVDLALVEEYSLV